MIEKIKEGQVSATTKRLAGWLYCNGDPLQLNELWAYSSEMVRIKSAVS